MTSVRSLRQLRVSLSEAIFRGYLLYILDFLLAVIEKGVEETDEQVLIQFGTEQFFEAKIGVGVDVAFAVIVKHGGEDFSVSGCKVKQLFRIKQLLCSIRIICQRCQADCGWSACHERVFSERSAPSQRQFLSGSSQVALLLLVTSE